MQDARVCNLTFETIAEPFRIVLRNAFDRIAVTLVSVIISARKLMFKNFEDLQAYFVFVFIAQRTKR